MSDDQAEQQPNDVAGNDERLNTARTNQSKRGSRRKKQPAGGGLIYGSRALFPPKLRGGQDLRQLESHWDGKQLPTVAVLKQAAVENHKAAGATPRESGDPVPFSSRAVGSMGGAPEAMMMPIAASNLEKMRHAAQAWLQQEDSPESSVKESPRKKAPPLSARDPFVLAVTRPSNFAALPNRPEKKTKEHLKGSPLQVHRNTKKPAAE
jgi:hypothetical protein